MCPILSQLYPLYTNTGTFISFADDQKNTLIIINSWELLLFRTSQVTKLNDPPYTPLSFIGLHGDFLTMC
jgi:hypothetical protein